MAVLRKRRFDELDPFSDLLFNTLLAFVMLFAVAMIAMNPKAKSGVIDAKAEFIITVTWPDLNPNDLDTWVQDPGGNLVWFRAREGGMMHLDRDDRGLSNDTIVINGQTPVQQFVDALRAARRADRHRRFPGHAHQPERTVMNKLLITLPLALLAGCASLQNAGTA